MHGVPVFGGTRVPVQTLFEYLEGGETLEDFLEGFPIVSRDLAVFTGFVKLLLDECVDERLRLSFPEHDCQTTRFAGLAGKKNGQLLDAAEAAASMSSSRSIRTFPI